MENEQEHPMSQIIEAVANNFVEPEKVEISHASIKVLLNKKTQLEAMWMKQSEAIDSAIRTIEGVIVTGKDAPYVEQVIQNIMSSFDAPVAPKPKAIEAPKEVVKRKRKAKSKKVTKPAGEHTSKQDQVMLAVVDICGDKKAHAAGELLKLLAKRKLDLTGPNLSGYLSKLGAKYGLVSLGRKEGWKLK